MWMSACILSIVNMHNANAIVKNLIPNISNKGQIPLIQKGYRRPIPKIEHMTWTYDPKPDPKRKPYKSARMMPHASFIFTAQPSHASLPFQIRLHFKVCESCSSYPLRLTDIGSKP